MESEILKKKKRCGETSEEGRMGGARTRMGKRKNEWIAGEGKENKGRQGKARGKKDGN